MRLILILALAAMIMVGGCAVEADPDTVRPDVVASFYPLAEAVRRVGGDAIEVRDLTPAGAEPHDLEITTDQVDALLDADLVVYLGGGFQPALEDALAQRDGPKLDAQVAATHEDDRVDPHVWLDPALMARIVGAVQDELTRLDPANADAFAQRSREYRDAIEALDTQYRTTLSDCERDLIVTAHDAFGRLAERYGLRVEPITGISPEAEPDPNRLAELADLVRREGVTTIFTEELVSPEIAETLAREAGVTTDVLSPIESLTEEQAAAGEDYLSLMRDNLDALGRALGCA